MLHLPLGGENPIVFKKENPGGRGKTLTMREKIGERSKMGPNYLEVEEKKRFFTYQKGGTQRRKKE